MGFWSANNKLTNIWAIIECVIWVGRKKHMKEFSTKDQTPKRMFFCTNDRLKQSRDRRSGNWNREEKCVISAVEVTHCSNFCSKTPSLLPYSIPYDFCKWSNPIYPLPLAGAALDTFFCDIRLYQSGRVHTIFTEYIFRTLKESSQRLFRHILERSWWET